MAHLVKKRFQKNQRLLLSLIIISVFSIGTFFWGFFTDFDPAWQGDILADRYQPPSAEHLFGTDKFARDVFSRVLYGGRVSLAIGLGVCGIILTVGITYGTVAGYWGGIVDLVMMRLLDFLLAFPVIFIVIPAVAIFELNHWYLIPLLGLTGWMEVARLVRAEVLSLKERDFVLAAKGMGFNRWRILSVHVIPNCLLPVLVIAPLKIAEVILLESSLSFLGIGVQPPTPSWGNMISEGREALMSAWWITAFPGLCIIITVLSFNLLGEGIKGRLKTGTLLK